MDILLFSNLGIMKGSAVVLLLMAVVILRSPIGVSSTLLPEELLENPPGKIHAFLFLPYKIFLEQRDFLFTLIQ